MKRVGTVNSNEATGWFYVKDDDIKGSSILLSGTLVTMTNDAWHCFPTPES